MQKSGKRGCAVCLKPCEYLTLAGVCSRNPCPYNRQLNAGQLYLYKKETANKLETLMYERDMTRSRLARLSNISASAINGIMSCAIVMPEGIKHKLSDFFGIMPESFDYGQNIIYKEKTDDTAKKKEKRDYREILPFLFPQ